jgi:hypothetical protein
LKIMFTLQNISVSFNIDHERNYGGNFVYDDLNARLLCTIIMHDDLMGCKN